MDVKKILEQVKNGEINIDDAAETLRQLPYENLGYARVDHHRQLRSGFAEVIFCQGKTPAQVAGISVSLFDKGSDVLGTRASIEHYNAVKAVLPQAEWHEAARIITVKVEGEEKPKYGLISVCTAGTADIPVAEEAALTAEMFGCNVQRIFDVGVSGIHRLLDRVEQIRSANVVIAVAGMEGALASVIGGLVERPVIAVPTSVGYGASFNGLSALLTMLNSCSAGIGVVNIDNGFGAGYLAAQINRLAIQKGGENN